MDTQRICGKCGARLTGVGTEQLCPSCLLEGGLGPDPEDQKEEGPSTIGDSDFDLRASALENPLPRPFGDYELLEEIGRGGMGIVYKGRQAHLDRLVAVKMLLFGPLAQPEQVQRFRTEAAAAASLQHPNIVAIHEVGFREGQHFFAMDYVAGQNLAEIVRDGPLPPKRAAAYVQTTAEAIQYAHERGILHRDLKPSNVLIDANDQPKVMDFGLAKRLEKDTELTLSGQVLGSPNYMPPEQASAHRGLVGKRSDVYSLGAILYHLLTGRAPFVAPTVAETLAQVQNAEPVSPTVLNPHLPRDLKTICLKCLEKEPARRYQCAQELADDLGRWLRQEPILARPMGPAGKAWRWCVRKPLVATLTAAVVLAVLVGFAGITWEGRQARKARDLAQGRLYAAQMKLAHAATEDRRLLLCDPKAGTLLTQAAEASILPGAGAGLAGLAFSPDGQQLAVGSGDGFVVILEVSTLQALREPVRLHSSQVTHVAFALGGSVLITGGGLGTGVKLTDVASGRMMTNFSGVEGSLPMQLLAVTPDGQRLATGSPEGRVHIYDIASHRLVARSPWKVRSITDLAFSPDGQLLAIAQQPGAMVLWDLSGKRPLRPLAGHAGPVNRLAFSPDGRTLASAGMDHTIRLWHPEIAQEVAILKGHTEWVWCVAFADHGNALVSGGRDGTLRLWRALSFEEIAMQDRAGATARRK